ncbi:MAG: hypothetical protein N2491_06510 [Negativicutes bacterium]|nr:hypothetical protein [Negativicutes bacterium]
MDFKSKNWAVVLATIMLTVAVLGGGQLLWQKYAVAKPLDTVLQGIDGVAKVAHDGGSRKDDTVKIYVTLQHAANLQKTYTAIMEVAGNALGGKRFKVIVADTRTPELEQLSYLVQPHIQEAVATGMFTQMASYIQEQAAAKNVAAQVFIDSANIYLKLAKDGAELYQIVPRLPDKREVK